MASSKLVAANTDLPHQPSSCSLSPTLTDLSMISPSMSMDDLLKLINTSVEAEPDPTTQARSDAVGSIFREGSLSLPKEMANRTGDEVWKEIVEGSDQKRVGSGEEGLEEEMTLEDFLTTAGALREEGVRGVPAVTVAAEGGSQWADAAAINGGGGSQFPVPSMTSFETGIEGSVVGGLVAETSRRGKRRVLEEPMDKASLQKQKRMIKNRESAARSRERKQAYTSELESLVSELEAENARLLKEEAEKTKERFKQLMEHLFPVEERYSPRPQRLRMLRRVNSVQW